MKIELETVRMMLAAAAATAMFAPIPARAQVSTWSLTGAGCVPTGQTAAGPGTFNSAGDVGFPAGRLGEIIVTCPVPSSLARAAALSITYRDTDGPGTAVQLRARLRQKSLEGGGVTDISDPFDSNNALPETGNRRTSVQVGSSCSGTPFVFDHRRFTYYIQVNMTKRTRLQNVLLVSVDLGGVLNC